MMSQHYCAPVADALILFREKIKYSFHSLPVFRGHSTDNSPLAEKYRQMFGDALLGSELTVTGKLFDSFFFPESTIRESEDLAAQLFGADGTLYITTGTTTSNQISANALYQRHGSVLIDKNCHQSLHFGFHGLGARMDYLPTEFNCSISERGAWSIDSLLAQVQHAEATEQSYEVIVLTAQSYEGVIYDIPCIIGCLLDAGVRTRKFLIDEDWGAANYFNPNLAPLTAMHLDEVCARYPDLEVVCTQSTHKSLSALRQGSMIHFRGSDALRDRLNVAKFRIHSTSPSYPILASLDLAQAQMAHEGTALVRRALELSQFFTERLTQDESWSCYSLCPMPELGVMRDYVQQDPCKVMIDIRALGLTTGEVQSFLLHEHGIYLNRITTHALLLNFHIGISPQAVDSLLKALAELQHRQLTRSSQYVLSECFVIPYPPGVPLLVPGEVITDEIRGRMESIRRSGIALLEV